MLNNIAVKIFVVIGLTIAMLIPLALVQNVVHERRGYRQQVEVDIAGAWSASQFVFGPLLTVPYKVTVQERRWNMETESYEPRDKTTLHSVTLIADTLTLSSDVDTELRWRGIYSVPVYAADLSLTGSIATDELLRIRNEVPGFAGFEAATLSIAVQDVRGLGQQPRLEVGGQRIALAPGSRIPNLDAGVHATLAAVEAGKALQIDLQMNLRGSLLLRFLPFASDATTHMRSSWPHPKFGGGFLPAAREISDAGFSATWSTSSFSTGIEQKIKSCIEDTNTCMALQRSAFGVELIETVDVYQKTIRATKYGILFIVLTFITFFLSETLSAARLHPMHYVLVGFALSIFYLLLISLSEHLGFALAYAMATAGCVLLIGVYLSGVLASRRKGLFYGGAIALLYGMLFLILRSEDFALLMGTLLLFTALTAVMLLTRGVNWHGVEFGRRNGKRVNDPSQRPGANPVIPEPAG